MKIFLITLLLATNIAFAQRKFLENICDYNINATKKAKDVNVKYFVPCLWVEESSDFPDLLKKYTYTIENGDVLLHTVGIKMYADNISDKDSYEMFSSENMEKVANGWGYFVSSRRMKIGGKNAVEVIFDSQSNNPTKNIRTMLVFLTYKNKLIVLSFAAVSLSKENSVRTFNRFQPLFTTLILKTKIYL